MLPALAGMSPALNRHTFFIEKVECARAAVVPDVPGERDVREDETDRTGGSNSHDDSFRLVSSMHPSRPCRDSISPQE